MTTTAIQAYREQCNTQAYDDVLDRLNPTSDDPVYLECYQFWVSVAGEKHFDHYA